MTEVTPMSEPKPFGIESNVNKEGSSPLTAASTVVLKTTTVTSTSTTVETVDSGKSEATTAHHSRQLSTPESSQTESEDVSPQVHRRRRLHRDSIPRLSISSSPEKASLGTKSNMSTSSPNTSSSVGGADKSSNISRPLHQSTPNNSPSGGLHISRHMVKKSASAFGLSLQIPKDGEVVSTISGSSLAAAAILSPSIQSPGGSSTASSRDTSPCREVSPLINSLKPPIILRKGPQGLGFTLRAIRVYFGDSNVYTVQHLVKEVTEGSPAFEAGLRPGDLITQVIYFINLL